MYLDKSSHENKSRNIDQLLQLNIGYSWSESLEQNVAIF